MALTRTSLRMVLLLAIHDLLTKILGLHSSRDQDALRNQELTKSDSHQDALKRGAGHLQISTRVGVGKPQTVE